VSKLASSGVLWLASLAGLLAFAYPFLAASLGGTDPAAQGSSASRLELLAPLMTAALVAFCLVVLLLELHGQAVNAKLVATLGLLVAVTSVLRFVETAIPGPGGFSPIFAAILLAGYVFGARVGFLMGSLTILASALITGGIGPWLPYQMFGAGWVGMSAGYLPHPARPRRALLVLTAAAVAWGFAYGMLLNLYFWPFLEASAAGQPGETITAGIGRYLAFYATSSLLWDAFRAAGNAVLLLTLGLPMLRVLERFRHRFQFSTA
jgi:energy-coupling factor transport system substrate-specific component